MESAAEVFVESARRSQPLIISIARTKSSGMPFLSISLTYLSLTPARIDSLEYSTSNLYSKNSSLVIAGSIPKVSKDLSALFV